MSGAYGAHWLIPVLSQGQEDKEPWRRGDKEKAAGAWAMRDRRRIIAVRHFVIFLSL